MRRSVAGANARLVFRIGDGLLGRQAAAALPGGVQRISGKLGAHGGEDAFVVGPFERRRG